MIYLIQVILYTGGMLLIYLLFLRNRPFYQLSRYYLLISAILPLFIPLIKLPQAAQKSLQNITQLQFELPEIIIGTMGSSVTQNIQLSSAWATYVAISILLLTWRLRAGYKLWRVIRNHDRECREQYTLIKGTNIGPGSIGKYILFPGQEVNATILEHELAHVRLKHTPDIVLLYAIQAVSWPNILLVWIQKELRQVHEFQADAGMQINKEDYASLLLSSVFNIPTSMPMHLFIIHPLKRRIMMLQKPGKSSPVKAAVLVGSAFSLFFITALCLQSCEKKQTASTVKQKDIDPNKDPRLIEAFKKATPAPKHVRNPDSEGIYTASEKMPEPAYDLIQYLSTNIKYPEYAKSKKIEGRVLVKFVVKEDGTIADVTILRSPDNSLSDEALRVVNSMPAWKPGEQGGKKVSVYYVVPISFKLN